MGAALVSAKHAGQHSDFETLEIKRLRLGCGSVCQDLAARCDARTHGLTKDKTARVVARSLASGHMLHAQQPRVRIVAQIDP